MSAFKKPLSPVEESAALNNLFHAEDVMKNEARALLIEHNLRLVAYIAMRYQYSGVELDELIAIGTLGLIKAVDSFKADKGSRIATYASRCIDNEILMLMRARKKGGRDVSLHESIGIDGEGNEITRMDVMEDTAVKDLADYAALAEDVKHLYRAMKESLSERERQIVAMRYGLHPASAGEVTQREVAVNLGISRSYVSRLEKGALEKLRKNLEKNRLM
jgi:RNA polymerase sporulation-specific sigma factor